MEKLIAKKENTINHKLLRLPIQFFNGEGGENNEEVTPETTENDKGTNETVVDNKDKADKTNDSFAGTNQDVNNLVSKAKKDAINKVLKDLGVDDITVAKDHLEKYRTVLDSEKTDLQRAEDENSKLSAKLSDYEEKVNTLEMKSAVLSAKVKNESVDDVIALANVELSKDNELSKEDAVNKVLERNPYFKETASIEENKKTDKPDFSNPDVGNGDKGNTSVQDQWAEAFKGMSGLGG